MENFNIKGDYIEIANTTIKSNVTVNVQATESVILKLYFWAKSGSTVSIKATQATSSSLLSAQAIEMEEDANSLTSLEQAVASQKTGNIDFSVYPNPNDGNFTVEVTGNMQACTLEIFNVSGRIMGKVDCNAKSVTVNRLDLPSGIYYLRFATENESIVKKIIVK
ncbi:MAG: T9SS type A sorting domain-containing protein [Dysgonamonadaceae bacterium]|jgi:hypothetical protein|nr:T9SS type A sorting domain-containing protein [Dysgonamonadaceae bacterium]